MGGHKYSQLLGIKRNPVEYKMKVFRRKVYAKLIKKSIRISLTGHRRGHLLDKLSEWLKYTAWLESKRRKKVEYAQQFRAQQLAILERLEIGHQRESKDIFTKSKSSISHNTGLCNSKTVEGSYYKNNDSIQNSISGHSLHSNTSKSAPTSGKVKLKIKVDPSRYRDSPNTSPSSFFPFTPTGINMNKYSHSPNTSAPRLQSTLNSAKNNDTIPSSGSSVFRSKLFNCAYCSKQFTIRSSYLRHARKQHRIDTKSQPFLQHLKSLCINTKSDAKNNLKSYNSTLTKQPLSPSEIVPNSDSDHNQSNMMGLKSKIQRHNKHNKTQKFGVLASDSRSLAKPSSEAPKSGGKKIKLSLKLNTNNGYSKYDNSKANVRHLPGMGILHDNSLHEPSRESMSSASLLDQMVRWRPLYFYSLSSYNL